MIGLRFFFTVLIGLQFSPAERAYLVEAKAQQTQVRSIISNFEGKFGKKVSKSQDLQEVSN